MSATRHLVQMLSRGRGLIREALRPTAPVPASPYDVFLTTDAHAINHARQEHLSSLHLDLTKKRVLEVGAGIGLHTPFFLERACEVVVTDGNSENVAETRRRLPGVRVEQVDLDREDDLAKLGSFDVVYCYGLLYHLSQPERAVRRMAEACRGQLLLETCVSLGKFSEVVFLRDFVSNNQATTGIGCRPTRLWVMEKLKQYFGHAYHAAEQPDHPDFPIDWEFPPTRLLYRAVFVGSRKPLQSPALTTQIPAKQARHVPRR